MGEWMKHFPLQMVPIDQYYTRTLSRGTIVCFQEPQLRVISVQV